MYHKGKNRHLQQADESPADHFQKRTILAKEKPAQNTEYNTDQNKG